MKCTMPVVFLAATFSIVGCSTITQSETQALALTTTYENKPVEADCQLRNDKGYWRAKSPTHVTVRKSNEDLEVQCDKEGIPAGLLKAVSGAAGSMFGNIIFGGAIGAIVDHSQGTGYDYPNQLPVKMGESVIVYRSAEIEAQQSGTTSSRGTRGRPFTDNTTAQKQNPAQTEPKPSEAESGTPPSAAPDRPPQ